MATDRAQQAVDRVRSAPLFVDTGAWYAYLNEDDPEAGAVQAVLEGTAVPLVTTNYVLDELVTLVQARASHALAVRAGRKLQDPAVVLLERVRSSDERAAWDLFRQRPDQGYSFTDCTSFVVMERRGIEQVVATDGDFAAEGFADVLAGGHPS